MRKILSTLALASAICGTAVAFDEDNARIAQVCHEVKEVAAAESVALPAMPGDEERTVANAVDAMPVGIEDEPVVLAEADDCQVPEQEGCTLAYNDADIAADTEDFSAFYDQLAHLAQNETVPGAAITVE